MRTWYVVGIHQVRSLKIPILSCIFLQFQFLKIFEKNYNKKIKILIE